MIENKAARTAATFFFIICVTAASQWCLNRFWLYHAQNRVLRPSDYTVSVLPATAGVPGDARLSDDNQFAVRVMTVGTSHAMDQVTMVALPIFLFSVIGLASTWYIVHRSNRSAM